MTGPAASPLVAWGRDAIPALAALWAASSPESVVPEELARTVGDGEGIVLADPGAAGAVAATARRTAAGEVTGHIRLIVVRPSARRQGVGRRLLGAAEEWLRSRGATTVRFGADLPRYLWPGIDVTDLATQSLALSAGYAPTGCILNLSLDTGFRAPVPAGVRVGRLPPARRSGGAEEVESAAVRADPAAVHPDPAAAADAVRALVARCWPAWGTEVDLALDAGTLCAAMVGGDVAAPAQAVGFCAHSTLRIGWIGPLGTDPAYEGRGIAAAVLAATCADLARGGRSRAEVAWVGPLGWFADRGATTSRVFRGYAKPLT